MYSKSYYARREAARARPQLERRFIMRSRRDEYSELVECKTWIPTFRIMIKLGIVPWILAIVSTCLKHFVFDPIPTSELGATWIGVFYTISEMTRLLSLVAGGIVAAVLAISLPYGLIDWLVQSIKFVKENPKSAYPKKVYIDMR